MVASTLTEDYQRLDVHPDASMLEVERAFFHLRALYADGTLANYGLLEQPQRELCLAEIEDAYSRIVTARRQLAPAPPRITAVDNAAAITATGETPGALLRQTRLQRGLSIKELANTLKIGHLHLRNIEEERYEELPATVYLRGFVRSYAKALDIAQPDELASRYLDRANNRLVR